MLAVMVVCRSSQTHAKEMAKDSGELKIDIKTTVVLAYWGCNILLDLRIHVLQYVLHRCIVSRHWREAAHFECDRQYSVADMQGFKFSRRSF